MAMAAAMIAVSAGCVTSTCEWSKPPVGMKSSDGHEVVATMRGMNTGVYLFYYIPLWSGKPRRPNRREYDTFEHQITTKAMRRMFAHKAKMLKADGVADFNCTESSSGVWTLWIFWKRAVRAEALAVKYPAKKKN